MSCFLKIELSPELIRLVERIAGGVDPAIMARIEDHMAKTRELLDALRAGVEADESRRAEIARLKQEAEDARKAEEIEDAEEIEEDLKHENERQTWAVERMGLEDRIAELEALPTLSDAEQQEFSELVARLAAGPPIPEPPQGEVPVEE